MALASGTIWEVQSGGSDTLNGGAFDPTTTAGMNTDGAATSADTASPVFTSASYNFVAGDVGAYLFIASGTNWTSGWYRIASVAANAATLSAALGVGVRPYNIGTGVTGVTTAAGCATTASPTGATWTIDYSQQVAAQFAYTDLASVGAGLLVASSAFPFAKQQVGNSLVITGGTNFTTGRYVIASVAAGVATVVGAANITTGAGVNGTGGLGGALASPGMACNANVAFNIIFVQQSGSIYSITSATTGVAGGCIKTAQNHWVGYTSTRTFQNTDTRPTLQLNASTATVVVNIPSTHLINFIFDGNTQTLAKLTSGGIFSRCKFFNFNLASTNAANLFFSCESTTNSATVFVGPCHSCVGHANTATPFTIVTAASRCLSYGNTGGTTRGFEVSGVVTFLHCVAYGNGADGFIANSNGSLLINCHSEANTGWGYQSSGNARTMVLQNNSAYNNTAGTVTGTPVLAMPIITLTSSAFTNAAGGDFSLNTTAGGGASLRAAGYPGVFPVGLTTGYLDIGAVQHADPAAGGGLLRHVGMAGGLNA